MGARPAAVVTVHVRGALPADLRVDGLLVGRATRARARVRLPASVGLGRHALAACRLSGCGRATPLVVTDGPVLGGCPVLPPDAAYNRDVSAAPVAPDSAALVAAQAAGHPIHLDLGSTQREYGIPFAVVPAGQRRLPLVFGTDGADYSSESDRGPVPVPADAPVEGGASASGDRHVLVLQRGRCVLTELYNAVRVRSATGRVRAWRVSSAARWDLTREQRRRPGFTSADAAGLPILPGLLRYDEAAGGAIRHALRFTLPRARRAYQPPASHCGTTTDPSAPPYGSRWRLKASFDESPYHGPALAIVRALKRYGLMFADQGSAMYVSGTSDPRWAPVIDELQNRHPIDGGAFEVRRGRRREHLRIAIASADGRDHRTFAQRAQRQPGRERPREAHALERQREARAPGLARHPAGQGHRGPHRQPRPRRRPRRARPRLHPRVAAAAVAAVQPVLPRRGPRAGEHPRGGRRADGGQPLRAATSRPTPASSRSRSPPTSGSSGASTSSRTTSCCRCPGSAFLRKYGTVAASPENAEKALRPARRCSCTPAATTRSTARPGSVTASTSTGARASSASRSSTTCRSSRWSPSAARRPRCSSRAASALARWLRLDRLLRLKVLPISIVAAVGRERRRLPGPRPAAGEDHRRGAAADPTCARSSGPSPTSTRSTTTSCG